ncbi:hypothetical protein IQ264_27350 [Phormidium sp. LEGE 05292]|uniref:hypothetical protein n=1 Tax=[Phormidium] sp. LEGE 05292 TaxID=767427 RepID=UPI00187DE329|nr:hypothetical protein [Phormidium sp. LEGE 05292]MBE9229123.1 hypothetical protein [Phormidium sp. LEGE 05292]
MRLWQFWWNTLFLSTQYDPPRFVEVIMLLLAIALLGLWGITERWPYLGLSLSYVVCSSVSVIVRESMTPSTYPRITQVVAFLLLIISIYSFAKLIYQS